LVAIGMLVTVAPQAQAEGTTAPMRLHYQRGAGAESCPDEAELRAAIAAHLGSDPFSDEGKRLVEITIERQDGQLLAHVGMAGETGTVGERTLHSSSPECRELAAAVALAISMVIDPLAPATPAVQEAPPTMPPPSAWENPAAPAAAASSESAAVTAATTAAANEQKPTPGPAFALSLAVLGAAGAAAEPTLGLSLQAGVAWPLVSLGIEGQAVLPVHQQVQSSTGATGTVDTFQLTASFVPCLTRWHLGVCGLVSAGATRVSASSPMEPRTQWGPYVGLGARVFGSLPLLDWLDARLQVDVLGQVTQQAIQVCPTQTTPCPNLNTVWNAPPVSGSMALAVAARFR
jgi:hypothetical protein